MPLNCFHGNSYLESLVVERDQSKTKALKLYLCTEGKYEGIIY